MSSRTYAQSLRTFAPNAAHQLMIQDAVHRMHRIKLLSSEFFTLHISEVVWGEVVVGGGWLRGEGQWGEGGEGKPQQQQQQQ